MTDQPGIDKVNQDKGCARVAAKSAILYVPQRNRIDLISSVCCILSASSVGLLIPNNLICSIVSARATAPDAPSQILAMVNLIFPLDRSDSI